MTTLYAQPYDISACGFYFDTIEEFTEKSNALTNSYGEPVEEFEIQFIDGESIDSALFRAVGVHQGDIASFFDAVDDLDDDQKTKIILAVGECGYSFDLSKDCAADLEIDIYAMDSLRDLAEQFVDDGLFGDIPEHLQHYIDYDAIARDLAIDYTETTVAGEYLIYRAA